jgi:hypothetical protein
MVPRDFDWQVALAGEYLFSICPCGAAEILECCDLSQLSIPKRPSIRWECNGRQPSLNRAEAKSQSDRRA